MSELPITKIARKSTPNGAPGRDGYRWSVALDHVVLINVDLSATDAVATGLGATELNDRVEEAIQRLARGRRRNDLDPMEQVGGWDGPVMLRAEHFE